ncbi:MAG: SGNH/GDSL hydrolase family protein [Myxococcales bacterium]|nr:SGNH/GDSL hydrolase family protein [Myxococcales bacterium]
MRLPVLAGLLLAAALPSLTGCAGPADGEGDAPDEASEAVGALPDAARYPAGQTQSPVSAAMVARWRAIAQKDPGRAADVFAKVGDSQTVNEGFMRCFAKSGVNLAGHDAPLGSPAATMKDTIDFFLGDDRGRTSFDRTSLSAKVGASASFALGGPLVAEVDATRARYAVVMYGSNDIQNAPTGGIFTYAKEMLAITDALTKKGVIPILTSPPPRPFRSGDVAAFGPEGADPWVPRYAAVVRGIAEARQVPFVDLERELRKLPDWGIGGDKLHLYAARSGACDFSAEGLKAGVNVRNLVTLEALHRTRVAMESGALDARPPVVQGEGTTAKPLRVEGLPFTDFRTTKSGAASSVGGYDCPSTGGRVARTGAGREIVYRLSLSERTTVRATVFAQGAADADVYVLRASDKVCEGRSDKTAVVDLPAGDHLVVVDAETDAKGGEYLLTITRD